MLLQRRQRIHGSKNFRRPVGHSGLLESIGLRCDCVACGETEPTKSGLSPPNSRQTIFREFAKVLARFRFCGSVWIPRRQVQPLGNRRATVQTDDFPTRNSHSILAIGTTLLGGEFFVDMVGQHERRPLPIRCNRAGRSNGRHLPRGFPRNVSFAKCKGGVKGVFS